MKKFSDKKWIAMVSLAVALAATAGPRGFAQAVQYPLRGAASEPNVSQMPRFQFENFTTEDGLPDNHVYAVLVDGDRVWVGTDNGLGLYEDGKWRTYSTQDGLAHRAVLSLALDRRTGDIWAGTMGGLSRVSGGRIVSYTQLNSGLSNDVVYGVSVEGENVWVATASGAGRLDLRTGEWSLYNERNTPMREIWVYGVSASATKVYFAVWGGGLVEYDQKTARWDLYDDPDGEKRAGAFQRSGPDSRHRFIGELRRQHCVGVNVLRRQPIRRPILAQFSDKRQRASFELYELRKGRGRQSRLVLHR